MNTFTAAVTAPFAAVGTAFAEMTRVVFSRNRGGWSVLMARTRIDYKNEVGDPALNSIVGAVVGWIARNFPEAPVRIVREGVATETDVVQPSASGLGAMLRLLERPNQYYSGVLQWMATIVDFVSAGNAYWLKQRAGNRPGGRVVGLWWIPERMLEPRWPDDGTVFIGWYEYTVDGITYVIDPRDIVHFRNGLDPNNVRKGLSRLASLFREIFTDEEAANFSASLLKNLGVPGVVISPSNTTGPNVRTDPESVKTHFMEKFGGDKRGEPLVLTAPTDVKVLSFNPTEMDLKQLRRVPEERISAVLGVPAGVAQLGAGLDRNTFTNYGEANKAAYTQGVIPIQRLIAAELEVQLLPEFGNTEGWDVFFDWSLASAMMEAVDSVWKRHLDAMRVGGITRAAFKKATGQKATPADDIYLLPNNYIMVPEGGPPPPSAPPPDRRQIPAGEEPVALLEAGPIAGEVRCTNCDLLLAEAAAVYTIRCRRCKTVNSSEEAA